MVDIRNVPAVHPQFLRAVEDTLKQRVRAALKAPLMKIAEEQVDLAVEEALEGLKIAIKGQMDFANDKQVIDIILHRTAGKSDG